MSTFGGQIVARGENLGGCTALKLELYEGGEPVAVLDRLQDVVNMLKAVKGKPCA